MEYELDAKSCALVAQYMWEEYKKSQQPPLFTTMTFDEWLQRILELNRTFFSQR